MMEKESSDAPSLAFSFLDESDESGFLRKIPSKDLFICKDSIEFDYSEKQTLEPTCVNVNDIDNSRNEESVELLDISMKSLPPDLDLNQADGSFVLINGDGASISVEANNYSSSTCDFTQVSSSEDYTNESLSVKEEREEDKDCGEQLKQEDDGNNTLDVAVPATLCFDRNVVSQFEKTYLPEFFSGKYDRTHFHPNQYLQIRNLFLDEWESRRPQPVRFRELIRLNKGIGNVVSFSRVCKFLTAIGAINNMGQVKVTLTGIKEELKPVETMNKSVEEGREQQASKPSTSGCKKTRKRKSYYLNEMGRLGIDPIRCGFTIPQSEIENVLSVFSNKKHNAFGSNQTSHFSSSMKLSSTQNNSTKLTVDCVKSQLETSNVNVCENKQIEDKPLSNSLTNSSKENNLLSNVNNTIDIKTDTLSNETTQTSSMILLPTLPESSDTEIQSKSIESFNETSETNETTHSKINGSLNVNSLDTCSNIISNQKCESIDETFESDTKSETETSKLAAANDQELLNTTTRSNDSLNSNATTATASLTRSLSGLSNGDIIKSSRTRPNPFKLIPCEKYGCNVNVRST